MSQVQNCQELANQASIKYGLPPGLLYSLIKFESGCQDNVVSSAGAIGIAQIVPKFHPNVNPYDPNQSVDYAGGLLKHAYDRFGSYALAVASYQAGESAVAKAGGIPNTSDGLTTTRDYVRNILAGAGLIDDSAISVGTGKVIPNNPVAGMLNPNQNPFSGAVGSASVGKTEKPNDGYTINPANVVIDKTKRKFIILGIASILLLVAFTRIK